MSEQPPVQQPDQPPHQPTSQPSNPPTIPMPAAASAAPGGHSGPAAGPPVPAVGSAAGPSAGSAAGPPVPPAGPATSPAWANAPKPNAWQRATSTSGGRWGLAIAAAALVFLMVVGVGTAGFLILRNHDRVNLLGQRQDSFSRGQDGPGNGRGLGRGNGNGQGPGADKDRNGQQLQPGMPGMPGRGAQGLGGLRNFMGGTALHGQVTATLNGSVQQLLFQRGEVTAVSDTSISLKSSDGFAGTYVRSSTTISRGATPVKGGQAFVLARTSDKVAITIIATQANVGAAPSS